MRSNVGVRASCSNSTALVYHFTGQHICTGKLEELRGKYEGEVRWRMADKRSPPPASDMPSYTFEQKAQNAEPYALAASASPAAEMRTA